MPYFLYILECANKTLYTGIKIRYTEEYPTRSAAAKREAEIKNWSRTKKIALIKGEGTIKLTISD
jgi:predicted GIY-YIG superfamily endonuclease